MNPRIATPTPPQMEWADCEIGVIIHYDIQVFEPSFSFRKQWGYTPSITKFNPTQLDTDQWIQIAKKAGAKYAILVTKHGSGLTLWPSKNHEYSVANSPWKNGKGDIVADFIASCKKYDIKPGFYYNTGCNAFMKFDMHGMGMPTQDSKEFKQYNQLVTQQLTELWTNYGDLFEIWFDGGHYPGGPDIISMLKKMQPNAVAFQGPPGFPHNIRWVGTERGFAPENCWSTIESTDHYDGTKEIWDKNKGDPNGLIWQPAETDTPNREKEWFWLKNQEYLVVPAEKLLQYYHESVGRNSNLLLGMVIDDRGLVPEEDEKQFKKFGNFIKVRFSNPIKQVNGIDTELMIKFDSPTPINQVVLMEEIEFGHIVRAYVIEAERGDNWQEICSAETIGHKRIHYFESIKTTAIRFRCLNSIKTPHIREFSVYSVDPLPAIPSKISRFFHFLLRLKGKK